jgi:uncharacterized protein
MPTNAAANAAPRLPQIHRFDVDRGRHLLVVDGSRIYGLDDEVARDFDRCLEAGDRDRAEALLERYGLAAPAAITDQTPAGLELRALSLAVAQKCNLGCSYCYARGGEFGAPARDMPWTVARAAVDRLLDGAPPGGQVRLAFLGGEPLVNRQVLRRATAYAARRAAGLGVDVGFAVTTNGTLLTPEDGAFFEAYGFAVTLSLDGIGEVHDRLRAFKDGRGSFERIVARVRPLLAVQRRMQVSARVTVTPRNLRLGDTLDRLLAMGFHSVGFSPMLSSPTGRDQLQRPELAEMLAEMVACGGRFEARVRAGERYGFANMVHALRELHRGTHRPYPCGAGAGYLGVAADGALAACHRFVEDPAGAMGSLDEGVDGARRAAWLAERHVHRQEPCRGCWARYLCGGGCHHEVIHRGRPACDYIRGWLHYALQAYVRLLDARPDYFAPSGASAAATTRPRDHSQARI